MTDKQALREELLNPAIGSKAHLRKLALALLDELEVATDACNGWKAMCAEADERLRSAEKRIAELESRTVTVKLPAEKFCPAEYAGSQLWSEAEVWNKAITACADALRAAGIQVIEGEG